jgi:hypothetical protein
MPDQWLLCVVEGRKFESAEFVDGRYHVIPKGARSGHDRESGIRYSQDGDEWLPDLDIVDLEEMEEE